MVPQRHRVELMGYVGGGFLRHRVVQHLLRRMGRRGAGDGLVGTRVARRRGLVLGGQVRVVGGAGAELDGVGGGATALAAATEEEGDEDDGDDAEGDADADAGFGARGEAAGGVGGRGWRWSRERRCRWRRCCW